MPSLFYNCCSKLSKKKKKTIQKEYQILNLLLINTIDYQYNEIGIDYPSRQKDWTKFEQNNKSIALKILFVHTIPKK